MKQNDSKTHARLGFVHPQDGWWLIAILGAVAMSIVWFLLIPTGTTVELSPADQMQMLGLARRQLVASLAGEDTTDVDTTAISDRLMRDGAAFVSLLVDGTLRGCMIDCFQPHEPLFANVLRNVQLAALGDGRFAVIGDDEIEATRIKISIVYDIEIVHFRNPDDLLEQLTPFVDGVIMEVDEQLATYLPSVWETFPEPVQFLSRLSVKAGWDADRWRTEPYPIIQTYRIYEFGESE